MQVKRLERIRQFVISEWDREYAYETTDVSLILQCDNRVSRYYLMKLVDEGLLVQLKYHGHTWYIHTDQAPMFKHYKYIGVKIS